MFAIEFFVGAVRGSWIRGLRRFATREAVDAVIAADWQNEARHLHGVYVRRAVLA